MDPNQQEVLQPLEKTNTYEILSLYHFIWMVFDVNTDCELHLTSDFMNTTISSLHPCTLGTRDLKYFLFFSTILHFSIHARSSLTLYVFHVFVLTRLDI
jgi:hypothetical protein